MDVVPGVVGPPGSARMSRSTSLEDLDKEVPSKQAVWRVVLTGGPCGGKTTALTTIAERLRSFGLQVFTVPENATLFSNAGAGFPVESTLEHQLCWETSRMIAQMAFEDAFEEIARKSGVATAIVCDRGVMDAKAYVQDEETWQGVLAAMGWREEDLLRRYDMVVHLVSTAIGAEQYYHQTVYRHETPTQAAALDQRIQQVWRAHPRRAEIDNSTDYEAKVGRVVGTIARFLNIAVPMSTVSFLFELAPSLRLDSAEESVEDFSNQEGNPLLPPECLASESIETMVLWRSQRLRLVQGRMGAPTLISGSVMKQGYVTECLATHSQFSGLLQTMQVSPRVVLRFRRYVWVCDGQFLELVRHSEFAFLRVEVEPQRRSPPTLDPSLSTAPLSPDIPAWLRGLIVKPVVEGTGCPDWQHWLNDLAHKYGSEIRTGEEGKEGDDPYSPEKLLSPVQKPERPETDS
eukprot:Hpha_TRINITY_DN9352_c0_g1::TRINITY_DN9352_c0_g1_i1::g.25796::m.25796